MSALPPLLRVQHLVREYTLPRESLWRSPATVKALQGVSFEIQAGRSLGIVGDVGLASNSASALFYTNVPDTTGGLLLELATGQTRNVASAADSYGHPGAVFIDSSVGTAAGSLLRYAYRDGPTAAKRDGCVAGETSRETERIAGS